MIVDIIYLVKFVSGEIMNDEYINEILNLAKSAYDMDEIPVGALVVQNGKIIGKGINNREKYKSVVGHAEINAIDEACKYIGDWRLDGCEMYVTLNPCMMCSGAIIESRISKVYYLCDRTNVCFNSSGYLNIEKINNDFFEENIMNLKELVTGVQGEKQFLLGNEAAVRGVIEAGVSIAATYPGTPSSEIGNVLSVLAKDANIYFEFSTNEKVAMEVAIGSDNQEMIEKCGEIENLLIFRLK